MKNLSLLLGTIFGTLLLIVGVAIMFSKTSAPINQSGEVMTDQAVLLNGATKIKGPENAPITIVEFSDFQCPACRAVQPTLAQISQEFPDKVKIVYRHFPLDSIHPNARLAAQATEAALAQGKFWEFHDKLFLAQGEWDKIGNKEELLAKFAEYAEELKIDKQQFLEKIESQEIANIVQSDTEMGNSIPVQATPTFFVNGKMTAAPQLLDTVQSLATQTAQ
jgi:protein-disulfide isomerase